jgi:ADP-dependent NAD(P)H-hydrate dehydratase / NAD(P)H-hydrate epimerase
MRVVNADEMRKIDSQAIEEFGFTEGLIIENVGVRGADFIEDTYLKDGPYGEIVFLVGNGNNGADGVAIARHLKNRGNSVRIFLLFPDSDGSPELVKQAKLAHKYGVKVTELSSHDQLAGYFTETQEHYLVIDAIIGVGFRVPLSDYLFDIINTTNTYADELVAIDIATGITADSGSLSGTAIQADYTLAVGLPKTGHYIGDGAKHSGEIAVIDAGFPSALLEGGDKALLTPEGVSSIFQSRNKFAHKNNFGHAMVVGGSEGLCGALIMASNACLRVGTGLVTAATWAENYEQLVPRIRPEIMTGLIPTERAEVSDIIKELEVWDTIVIGPGMGRSTKTRDTVVELLNNFAGPVVVDADAIKVLSLKEDAELLKSRKGPTVFTPHIGEFASFVGVKVSEVLERPIEYLKEVVDTLSCCVVLKGSSTYLGFPNGEVFINHYPNDGMASGGTGDVLAGILGGLLAQNAGDFRKDIKKSGLFADKSRLFEAICLGVMAHTLSGKFAADSLGVRAMTAGSIIDFLPNAFNELNQTTSR